MNEIGDLLKVLARLAGLFLMAAVVIVGAFYMWLVAYAQWTCSIIPLVGSECRGQRAIIWMGVFFATPVGIPAVLLSIFFCASPQAPN